MKNLKRGGLACVFVIVSIFFSIYPPGFPPFQGSFQAYAQEAGFFGEVFHVPEESQVYYLREHLNEMLEHEYRALQANTVMVRKHLQWNIVPAKYDAFHMTLYDLWLRNHFTRYY